MNISVYYVISATSPATKSFQLSILQAFCHFTATLTRISTATMVITSKGNGGITKFLPDRSTGNLVVWERDYKFGSSLPHSAVGSVQ